MYFATYSLPSVHLSNLTVLGSECPTSKHTHILNKITLCCLDEAGDPSTFLLCTNHEVLNVYTCILFTCKCKCSQQKNEAYI